VIAYVTPEPCEDPRCSVTRALDVETQVALQNRGVSHPIFRCGDYLAMNIYLK